MSITLNIRRLNERGAMQQILFNIFVDGLWKFPLNQS